MKGGFKIVWTARALDELRQTVSYLDQTFTGAEMTRLARKIESTRSLIDAQPSMFHESPSRPGVRQAVILRHNTMYYRVRGRQIGPPILRFSPPQASNFSPYR